MTCTARLPKNTGTVRRSRCRTLPGRRRPSSRSPFPPPKQAIAPLAVLGFAIAAVLIVVSLVARVQLSQASAEVSALEDQYTQLQEQQTRLRIDYESAFNLTEIEDYAIHELGMQKPRSDQLYYISSDATDTAVVLDQNAAEPLSLADRLGDFFSSILEYFR